MAAGVLRARTRLQRASRAYLRRAIRRVSFTKHAMGTSVSLGRNGKLHVTLANITSIGGKGRSSITVTFSDAPIMFSEDDAVEWIYLRVKEVWVHELNEMFLLNGHRRNNLHNATAGTLLPPEDVAAERFKRLAAELRILVGHYPELR
jgi:hypothetical protein